jgi:Calcineurin-like phosphoesterase
MNSLSWGCFVSVWYALRLMRVRLVRFDVIALLALLTMSGVALAQNQGGNKAVQLQPLSGDTWRFVVSGDSRNCGDVVMPAIEAQSARYTPRFYWHLGDLRAIYKIDEDMAAAAEKAGRPLTCEVYEKIAWSDFIENQIVPFGSTPFYLGIGNHEVIPPKTQQKFTAQFADWLTTPALLEQRRQDGDKDLESPLPYYHWTLGGVDFIYLDNASGSFSPDQREWFDRVLALDAGKLDVRSIVVGMHEALPDSIAGNHAMCDDPHNAESCGSGHHVYNALLDFQKKKRVYVLASHSHFYMTGIFDNLPPDHRLPGWIVGTAGAVRYKLPENPPPDARTDVYGYLVATVEGDGRIEFDFQQVLKSDVPKTVRQLYPASLISWCFAHNSESKEVHPKDITNRCLPAESVTGH